MVVSDATTRQKRKNLTPDERAAVVAFFLRVSIESEPPIGAIRECAIRYECSDAQISRLWRRAAKDIKEGRPINYESGRKGRSGRKSRLTDEFRCNLNHAIELIPLEDRTDLRTLASALGIVKSTLHDYFQAGVFRCHTTRPKPILTDEQRVARVQFALSFVQVGPYSRLVFNAMWSFVVYEPAERSSKNRLAGTLEMKSYTVDRDVYRRAICSMVIPSLKKVWPSGKRVVIQHDNAKPHVTEDDPVVRASREADRWDISIPPQQQTRPTSTSSTWASSRRSSRSSTKKRARTIERLVDNVDDSYKELPYLALDRVFMTYQSVLEASMNVDGSNKYPLPHLHKDHLVQANGLLLSLLPCSSRIHTKAQRFLSSVQEASG